MNGTDRTVRAGIVIPAWNEAATIAEVVRGVASYGTPIVVNDCSTDDTARLAREAGAELVDHTVNRGYDGALQSGFERAAELGLDIVVTFDADGQHEADTLAAFMAPLRNDQVDLVLGLRPQPARVSERLFSLYTRWRYGVGDILCGLKGYRMALFHRHGRFDGTRSIGTELALFGLREGVRFTTAPVPIHPRVAGSARFGSLLRANGRILRAMLGAIRTDLTRRRKPPTPGDESVGPAKMKQR